MYRTSKTYSRPNFKGNIDVDREKLIRKYKEDHGIGIKNGYNKDGILGSIIGGFKSFLGGNRSAKQHADEEIARYYSYMEDNIKQMEASMQKQKELDKYKKAQHDEELRKAQEINKSQQTEFAGYVRNMSEKITSLEQEAKARSLCSEQFQREQALMQQEMFNKMAEQSQQIYAMVQSFQNGMQELQKLTFTTLSKISDIMSSFAQARANNDTDAEERIKAAAEEATRQARKEWEEKAADVNKYKNLHEMYDKMYEIKHQKGFGKLGGYKVEKDTLLESLGNSILLEKEGHNAIVPNGVLFFGPQGCGKTTFAQAFAEQLGCRIVNIRPTNNDDTNLENIENAAIEAEENFKKDHVRTILNIDEFDIFVEDRRSVGILKGFMDRVSKDYHCTVFATTNYFENIDKILLRDGRFDIKIPLAPANKQNIKEILQHTANNFVCSDVNFDEIAEKMYSVQQEEMAYSNARIVKFMNGIIQKAEKIGQKVGHSYIMDALKDLYPDIQKDALDLFKKQRKIYKAF
jgi:SpoVK/Ycf46/Vps4 family AAA+-type ATPase